MSVIDLIKEWSGTALLIGGSIWGLVEIYYKWIAKSEDTKQEKHHTEQEKLATEEKTLDLDSRRVKASEEVASEALEDMAEARRENLKLLESDYEKSKAIIEMQAEIKGIKAYINRMEEERKVLCWFFCRRAKVCPEKEPVFGPFQLDVATLESLKKMIENGQNS